MRIAAIIVLSIFCASFSSALEPPVAGLPSVTLPPELDRVLRDYEREWQARDAAALAGLFTEDGFVLSNGKPPVRGRDSIVAAYKDAGGGLSLRALAFAAEGKTGYIIGAYAPARNAPDVGKFVLVLARREDGRWLIVADMDNADRGPKPPAASTAPTN